MKLKNKIITIIIIIILLINITSNSFASLTDEEVMVVASWKGDLYYSYNDEEKTAVTWSCNNLPAYLIKKDTSGGYFYPDNLEEYNNKEIINILKNGYGVKTMEELELLTVVEAYLATQEAIYITLESRDINDYVIDGGNGTRILNATKKILEAAANETEDSIEIELVNNDWETYEEDDTYKYKEYEIKSTNSKDGEITIANENCKILDKDTMEEKSTFLNGDKFLLVVPKNEHEIVQIKLSYEKEDISSYICGKTDEEKNYIVFEQNTKTIEKTFDIDIMPNFILEILNIDEETRQSFSWKYIFYIR